jgi:hypothetical protein
MPAVVSAGVYIQERDDSLYAPAISPTIMGIVGTSTKGTPNQAVLVTNEGQLVDTFGRPRTKDFGMHAAIEALKAGRLVYFVRIAGAAATSGSVTLQDGGSAATQASIGPSANGEPFNLISGATLTTDTMSTKIRFNYNNGAPITDADVVIDAVRAVVDNSPGAATYNLSGIAAGADTTLGIAVDGGFIQTITFSSSDPLIAVYTAVTPEEVADVINDQLLGGKADFSGNIVTVRSDRFGSGSRIQVSAGSPNDANSVISFTTTLQSGSGDVSDITAVLGSELKTVIEADITDFTVTVGTSGEITIATNGTPGAAREIEIESASTESPAVGAAPLINLTPLDTTITGTDSGAAGATVTLTANSVGSWSDDLDVRITASAALAGTVKLEVLFRNIVVETYDKLSKGAVVSGSDDLIVTINSGNTDGSQPASEFLTASDANPSGTDPIPGTFALSAGLNGDDWTSGTVIGSTTMGVSTGMQIFRDPDSIFINVFATPGISYAAVISEGIDICTVRGDCIFIADAPSGLTPQEVTDWHNGSNASPVTVDQEGRTEVNSTTFNSSYAALYYPFVTVFDKFNDTQISIPPSSIVLRTIAHTDNVAEPWFAPAGPNRTQATSVLDIEFNATQGEQDLMQLPGNNVNPIRNINGVGIVIMGQKTLQRAPSALDRVNVRRLLLAIEKVISQAVFFLLFEQNDAVMWRRFITLVSPVMKEVQNRRGVFDFRVIADSSTTTDLLIDQNTFVGKIFLKPTKSAEKLIVPFNLVPTGANFDEFVQA